METNAIIHEGRYLSNFPHEAVLAHFIMSSDSENSGSKIKQDWETGDRSVLFAPDELDIYVNKVTQEAFIFHGKEIDYDNIKHLEYNPADYTVDVVKKDGTQINLGVKIQWLVRPYFTKAKEINIVQTKDGDSVNGTVVPLIHKKS